MSEGNVLNGAVVRCCGAESVLKVVGRWVSLILLGKVIIVDGIASQRKVNNDIEHYRR